MNIIPNIDIYTDTFVQIDCFIKLIDWIKNYLNNQYELFHKPCIILDIDGTILKLIDKFSVSPIPLMSDIIKFCKEKNIKIFFITSRKNIEIHNYIDGTVLMNRDLTKKHLSDVDIEIEHDDDLYMLPNEYGVYDVSFYKEYSRNDIEIKGYTILLNVGDRWSDLINNKRFEMHLSERHNEEELNVFKNFFILKFYNTKYYSIKYPDES